MHRVKSPRLLYLREHCGSLTRDRARSQREQRPERIRAAPTSVLNNSRAICTCNPRSLHWGEPSTIMRLYDVSFEGTNGGRADSSRLRDFSHNAERREKERMRERERERGGGGDQEREKGGKIDRSYAVEDHRVLCHRSESVYEDADQLPRNFSKPRLSARSYDNAWNLSNNLINSHK